MSQQVLYIGASGDGMGVAGSSPAVHALSLAVEVLVDGSSAGAELEVNLLHQGRVLGANVASIPERDQEPQGAGHVSRGGNWPRELGLDIPIPEGMGLEPGAAMVRPASAGKGSTRRVNLEHMSGATRHTAFCRKRVTCIPVPCVRGV